MSMKYLLVIGLVLVVFWLWRHNRQAEKRSAPAPRRQPGPPPAATEIVECEVCKIHLPKSEALMAPGGGIYCSEAHRRQAAG